MKLQPCRATSLRPKRTKLATIYTDYLTNASRHVIVDLSESHSIDGDLVSFVRGTSNYQVCLILSNVGHVMYSNCPKVLIRLYDGYMCDSRSLPALRQEHYPHPILSDPWRGQGGGNSWVIQLVQESTPNR